MKTLSLHGATFNDVGNGRVIGVQYENRDVIDIWSVLELIRRDAFVGAGINVIFEDHSKSYAEWFKDRNGYGLRGVLDTIYVYVPR